MWSQRVHSKRLFHQQRKHEAATTRTITHYHYVVTACAFKAIVSPTKKARSSHNPNNNTLPLCCLVKQWMTAYRSVYVSTVALACRCRMKISEHVPDCVIKGSRDHAIWFTYLSFLQQHSTVCLIRNQMILYWRVVPISKGKFLHSAVSRPWKRFTLHSRQTCSFQLQLDISGKH